MALTLAVKLIGGKLKVIRINLKKAVATNKRSRVKMIIFTFYFTFYFSSIY